LYMSCFLSFSYMVVWFQGMRFLKVLSNQLANIFTKPLGRTLFENFRSELKMVNTIQFL